MSKLYDGRYLDKEKTILYTANNYYKYALTGYKNTNILKEYEGLTSLVQDGYIIAKSRLTKALLFGNIEACSGLALFNNQGIGGYKSIQSKTIFSYR